MKKKVSVLAFLVMLTLPILAQTSRIGSSPGYAGEMNDDAFSYVITNPKEGDEMFTECRVQFPKAADLRFIPAFSDRSSYVKFTVNGKPIDISYAYHGKDGNTLLLDLGGVRASTKDHWEAEIDPGLFALYDSSDDTGKKLGENAKMTIVMSEGLPVSKVDFSFTCDPVSDDPYDETMTIAELPEIKLTFPKLDVINATGAPAEITLGGTAVDKSRYTVKTTGTDNVVTITFNPALTTAEDAELNVTFPAKSLTGKAGEVSDENQAIVECRYYKLVPAVSHDLTIDFYQPAPDANGNLSVTKSLAMAMFVCDTPNIKVGGGTEPHITLKEVNGDYECTTRLKTLTGMVSGKSTFYTAFDQPKYNGEYTLTLSAGAIGDDRWRLDHTMGHTNGEVVLKFNIVDGEDREVSGPHIDLSLPYVGTEIVSVKGVPSDDNIYWYANIIEASRYPGDKEMVDAAIDFFKLGAETFAMDWLTVFRMTAKTGEYTWTFGDLFAANDYIAYAFGLDDKGNLYMPLTKINVRTADPIVSDNKFTLEVVSLENGTQPETKKLTVKVTPTNSDQYAVVVFDKYQSDVYNLTDSISEKNFLRSVLRPLVTTESVHTGTKTVVIDNIKIDAVMQAAVFGYEGYETTSATLVDFNTIDNDLEAVIVEAYDPTISGASATVYSFDMVRPFILGVISKADAEALGGIETVHENLRKPGWEADGMGYYDWRYFARGDLKRKAVDGKLSEIASTAALKWNTDYYVYAYLMDEGGYRTSPVYYDLFTTASRNKTDNSFELKLTGIKSNAPYSPETYTADLMVVPSDKDAPYSVYYGDTYDFEKYLDEGRVDDWLYDVFMQRRVKRTYNNDLDFGYGSVRDGRNYILIVTGFDEAPNTEPTWMLFNKDGIVKESGVGVETLKGESVRIRVENRDIIVDGEFLTADVYTIDGIKAGNFSHNVCRLDGPGCYIVRVATANGIEIRKIAVN